MRRSRLSPPLLAALALAAGPALAHPLDGLSTAEIAEVVHFLSSPASAAITGQTVLADGGWSSAR